MVSTRLQSNSGTNDNSVLPSSDAVQKLASISANGERSSSRVTSTRLQSSNNPNENGIYPVASDGLQKTPSIAPRIVSNRQHNTDNSMLPSSEVLQKCSCITGCMTRSLASIHPNTCHSKDTVQSKAAITFFQLPREIIEKIVTYCGFKTASNLRLVSTIKKHRFRYRRVPTCYVLFAGQQGHESYLRDIDDANVQQVTEFDVVQISRH